MNVEETIEALRQVIIELLEQPEYGYRFKPGVREKAERLLEQTDTSDPASPL